MWTSRPRQQVVTSASIFLKVRIRGRGTNGKTVVSDEKWHHTAGSYDGKKLLLYVDGVQEAEGNHKGNPDFMDDPLMLGAGKLWTFKGIIDDVGYSTKRCRLMIQRLL